MGVVGAGGPGLLPPPSSHPTLFLLDFSLQEQRCDWADSELFFRVSQCSGVWKKGMGVCAHVCVGASASPCVGLVREAEPACPDSEQPMPTLRKIWD